MLYGGIAENSAKLRVNFWLRSLKKTLHAVNHHDRFLEDRNLLKLRSLDSLISIFLSDNSIWDNELKCSKCYDRKAKIAFKTSKCCIR